MVKSKLPPQNGSILELEAVEPHPWKRALKSIFHKKGTFEDQDHSSMIEKIIV